MQSHAEHSAVKWASFFSSIMLTEPLMKRHSETISVIATSARPRFKTRYSCFKSQAFVIQKSH